MKKLVYLKMDERNKKVYIDPDEALSDCASLRAAMAVAAGSDEDLRLRMEGCTIIFQVKEKVEDEIQFVDVDEDEIIESGRVLYPLFCVKPVRLPNLTNSEDLEIWSDAVIDENGTLVSDQLGDSLARADTPKDATKEYQEEIPAALGSVPSPSACPPPAKKLKVTKKSNVYRKPLWDTCPEHILKLRDKKDLFERKVYNHYGNYLKRNYDGILDTRHYSAMAEMISIEFPELSDPGSTPPYALIRSRLSQVVRNAKRIDSKASDSSESSCEGPTTGKQSKARSKSIIPDVVSLESEGSSAEPTLDDLQLKKELQENCERGATTHVMTLIKESFKVRRKWINSVPLDSRISYITDEYPHLLKADLIIIELSIIFGKDKVSLLDGLEKSLEEVCKFSKIFPEDAPTEVKKIDMILELYHKFKPKNTSKTHPPCMTVLKANQTVKGELVSSPGEAARCVVYTLDDSIPTSYIIADSSLRIKVLQPTACKILLVLIGTYRVWDKVYPNAYKTLFSIFECYGLGVNISDCSDMFKKFRRDFAKWRESALSL